MKVSKTRGAHWKLSKSLIRIEAGGAGDEWAAASQPPAPPQPF